MTPHVWLRALGLALCVGAVALAGCGGGGGGSSIPHASGGAAQDKVATATLHILVPEKTTNGKRRPAYVSPSTTQLAWSINGVNQTLVPLATPSPCSTTGSGLSCTVNFQLAPGTYTFVFTLEDANSQPLSVGTSTNYTLQAGVANTLTVTLGGVATGFQVTSASNNFGTSGSLFTVYGGAAVTLNINPVDVDGNLILNTNPGAPTITATLLPSPSPPAALSGSGNTWTLTSTYQSNSPTQPGSGVLSITASPYPNSGATGVTSSVQFLFYVPWLVITNSAGNVIAFDEQGNVQSPNPIRSGLPAPAGIAWAASTAPPYLYVATVTTPTPVPTPTGTNTLGPNVGGIVAYNGDGSTPSPAPTPAFSSVGVPVGLAFDTNNNQVYAANSSGTSLQAFPAAGGSNVIGSPPTISGPTGIVFNSTNNELYVSTTSGVFAYTESGALDSSVSFSGLSSAAGVAYDQADNEIYVVSSSGLVSVYPAGGGALVTSFSTAITSPTGLLFDPYQHWVYVIGSTGIAAYNEAGARQTLSGSFSGLGTPTSITVVE
jgi:hypothetical protein